MNTLTPIAPVITPVITPQDNDQVHKPSMYAVVLVNDATTSPDFVTKILREVFRINVGNAYDIMMAAHRGQRALVHIVTKDVAESELQAAHAMVLQANPSDYDSDSVNACELTFVMEAE